MIAGLRDINSVLRDGLRAVAGASLSARVFVALAFALLLVMLPFGRGRLVEGDAGGLLAPLAVDSGLLSRHAPGLDFYSIYDAGARWLDGRPVYAWQGDPARAPYATLYRYPPITLPLLALPLNVLPPGLAFKAWCLFLLLLVVGNFLACCALRSDFVAGWALLWFCWFPLVPEFHMGQFTLLLSTLLLWGLRSAKGELWAGAVWLKLFPLAMAAPLWLSGRRKLIVYTVLALVVTGAIWKVTYPDDHSGPTTIESVLRAGHVPYAGAMGMQEAWAALCWIVQAGTVMPKVSTNNTMVLPGVLALVVIYTIAVLLATWWHRRSPTAGLFGLFWLAWFWVFKDCWEHHYMLLQGLLAYLLLARAIPVRLAVVLWLLAGTPSLWYVWNMVGYDQGLAGRIMGLLYFLQKPAAVALLSIYLAINLYQTRERLT